MIGFRDTATGYASTAHCIHPAPGGLWYLSTRDPRDQPVGPPLFKGPLTQCVERSRVEAMVHVAAWAIYGPTGNRVARLRYKDRDVAERLVATMNEKDPPLPRQDRSVPGPKYYLSMVKEPITEYPSTVAVVVAWPRRISGAFEDKVTGQRGRWTKTFVHVEVTSLHEGRHLLKELFVAHVHRGELRVNGPCGRVGKSEFEEWARARWPEGWEQVVIRLEG